MICSRFIYTILNKNISCSPKSVVLGFPDLVTESTFLISCQELDCPQPEEISK